jgi:hypothetical protein
MDILYFAYGSNMLTERMLSRIPSAKPVGCALLEHKRLVFNKKSKDGSGKANLIDDPECNTWGALYKLDMKDIALLDKIEGGYTRLSTEVQLPDGSHVLAKVYVSIALTDEPIAYEWYKSLVLKGAKEHELPGNYIDYLVAAQ